MLARIWGKGNPCVLLARVENSTEIPLKKLKTDLPYDPAILLLGIYPKETELLSQK